MKTVTKQEFLEYFEDRIYTTEQGCVFHSTNFIVEGEVVGYMETSSWGTFSIYKLKYGTVNSETISFIGNIIKNKL